MAKATSVKQEDVSKMEEGLNIGNVTESVSEVLKQFENVDNSQLMSITKEYLSLEEKKTYNFCFMGIETMTNQKGQQVEAVSLIDKDGKQFISGSIVLVSNLKKVTKLPCLVKIVTKSEVQGQNGKYLDLDVYTFAGNMAK